MQSRGGGWGAFDKDNDKKILTKIPFGDFGELLDPPSADVTAHVVEAFAKLGLSREHPAMVRALDYLRREQEADGAWFGRWGVNYVYGTSAVLPALAAIGEDMSPALYRPRVRLASGLSAGKRRLGRELCILYGHKCRRPRHRYRLANGLGADGSFGRQSRARRRSHRARLPLPDRTSGGRHLGRAGIYRHRLSRLRRGPDDQAAGPGAFQDASCKAPSCRAPSCCATASTGTTSR